MKEHFKSDVTVKAVKLKKAPVVIPTVSVGFDEQSFRQASLEEKVKMITPDLLAEIKLGEEELIFSDEHEMIKEDYSGGGWICKKINGLSKCLSGIDQKHKSKGMIYFYCWPCRR